MHRTRSESWSQQTGRAGLGLGWLEGLGWAGWDEPCLVGLGLRQVSDTGLVSDTSLVSDMAG